MIYSNYLINYFQEIKFKIYHIGCSFLFFIFICYNYKLQFFYFITKLIYSTEQVKKLPSYYIITQINEMLYILIKFFTILSFFYLSIISLYALFKFLKPGFYFFEYKILNLTIKLIIQLSLIFIILIIFIFPYYYLFFLFYNNTLNPITHITIFFEPSLLNYLNFFYFYLKINFYILNILIIYIIVLQIFNLKHSTFRPLFFLSTILILILITPSDFFNLLILYLIIFSCIEFCYFSKKCLIKYYQLFLTKPVIKP